MRGCKGSLLRFFVTIVTILESGGGMDRKQTPTLVFNRRAGRRSVTDRDCVRPEFRLVA
jgi:hypothetical protein